MMVVYQNIVWIDQDSKEYVVGEATTILSEVFIRLNFQKFPNYELNGKKSFTLTVEGADKVILTIPD